jgi:hypothetical protein
MTHLTATDAATAHGQRFAISRTGQQHRLGAPSACFVPPRAESVFYSPVPNFLEMRDAAFHYSVMVGSP